MKAWNHALDLLPEYLRSAAVTVDIHRAEEIRLRVGKRPAFLIGEEETFFSTKKVSCDDITRILEKATDASMHAVVQALREGYLSYRGLRIGVCGTVSNERGKAEGFHSISSLAIRIPREYPGLCENLIRQLYSPSFQNTLIVSPPGAGKTTALRDMIRGLSERGLRIGVVDERNELSASDGAQARFDLGEHSDIIIGIPKATACMMLLRTMNPQILAMDEISMENDIASVEQIAGCGVGILATAHAADSQELGTRPLYRRLLDEHIFSYVLNIRQIMGERSYKAERLRI